MTIKFFIGVAAIGYFIYLKFFKKEPYQAWVIITKNDKEDYEEYFYGTHLTDSNEASDAFEKESRLECLGIVELETHREEYWKENNIAPFTSPFYNE